MKVYFTTGYENPKVNSINIRKILDTIVKEGHSIIKRPLKSEHGADLYKVDEEASSDIFDFLDLPVDKIYSEANKRIKSCDIVITETSYSPSPGLGFEVGIAIHERKPVLILSSEESNIILSEVIEGNPPRYMTVAKYGKNKSIEKIISDFIKDAKQKLDTKFILIIPAEIDRYLEWASKEKRMHKAQLVREAIDKIIEEDNDYQTFMNSL
ncbi:Eco57I restriction-modification methylase domain-containing protein [Candidatus Dojkabacteria bacterium]|nr:Eco57I restriction-modification methylase domain-containing protein [Candidatus Dojkabacteria bacterium]